MSRIGWNCYRKWQPNALCLPVNYPGEHETESGCYQECLPPSVPGFEIIGMGNSCNGCYITQQKAYTPEQCAYYCNKDMHGCKYFMWDSTKQKQDSTFIMDDNCIIFSDIPKDCTEMITTYPATIGSIMYMKSEAPGPSGV